MPRHLLSAVLLLASACAAPAPRGYYRPEGAPPGAGPGEHVEQSTGVQVEAVCQGVYVNTVDGRRTASVHVQLQVARTAASELLLPRAALVVDVRPPGGGPRTRHALSEAFSGRRHVEGDLSVPGWTRRPFDLFFDDPALLADGVPPSLLLRWELHADGAVLPGQCAFEAVPDGAPGSPAALPPADASFGYRDGWYLPGARLGLRRLRTSGEERLHHVFHEPEGWLW